MKTQRYQITGLAPLLMHSGRGVNVLDPFAVEKKRLASNRATKNTEEGQAAISRIEWFEGLYTSPSLDFRDGMVIVPQGTRVVIPAVNIMACAVEGAKKSRLGKTFKSGMFVERDAQLIYPGPQDPVAMWEDGSFTHFCAVRNQAAKIMRTRPVFREWSVVFDVAYNAETLDEQQIYEALDVAGQQVGLGDWRGPYGRFEVERVKA